MIHKKVAFIIIRRKKILKIYKRSLLILYFSPKIEMKDKDINTFYNF